MSDLDDDLLALAGAGSDGSDVDSDVPLKKPDSKKRKKLDESDLDFDDDDDNLAENDDATAAADLVNPYPLEGKYRDEQDRENLLNMDEMKREEILFERSQEMESYNEKIYLQQRMKQQAAQDSPRATRSSKRNKTSAKTTSKLDKLSELRKQREQKQRRMDGDFDDEEEEEDEDDNLDDEIADLGGYEDDYEDEEEVKWGSGRSKFAPRSYVRASLDDINKIVVGRSMLTKYCYYNGFNETILDCFTKVNVGVDRATRQPLYRMVRIDDVKSIPQKPYSVAGSKIDLYLTVTQNKNQTKEFPLTVFSDSPISPQELDRYKIELEKTGEELPYVDDVNEKHELLQHLTTRGLSDKDVNEMIERKQKLQANVGGYNAVFEKSKLLDLLKIAKQEGNTSKAESLQAKLTALENTLASQTNTSNTSESLNTMSKVNERNRRLNQKNIRKAEIKSSQLRKVVENNPDGGDPFSRFKTATRVFYQDVVQEENKKALVDAQLSYQERMDEKSKNEAKIEKSTYRVLGVMDQLIKQVDVDLGVVTSI